MESKKDKALIAKQHAEQRFVEKDFVGAKNFALIAQMLFPDLEGISQMVATFDIYVASEGKVNGEIDFYSILGLKPSADKSMVKKQYERLAVLLHPDKNRTVGADGAFRLVSEAWNHLLDNAKRATYDLKRNGQLSNTVVAGAAYPNNCAKSSLATFWTLCTSCKVQYEYLGKYVNKRLSCKNCRATFFAVELRTASINGSYLISKVSFVPDNGYSNSNSHGYNNNMTFDSTNPVYVSGNGAPGYHSGHGSEYVSNMSPESSAGSVSPSGFTTSATCYQVRVSIDDTDDMYYQHTGYHSCYYSSKDNEITLESMEGGDDGVSQQSGHDSIMPVIKQASSHSLLNPRLDATQVHEDGHHLPSNIWHSHADPTELEGFSLNGRIDAVGEGSSYAISIWDNALNFEDVFNSILNSNLHESQQGFHNGEMDIIISENEQINQPCDLVNSVHVGSDYNAVEDGQDKNPQSVEVKHKKTQQIDAPEKHVRDKSFVHGGCDYHALDIGQNCNPQSDNVKDNTTQKKEIPLECIRTLMSQNMRLVDAAKQLDVSRSTLKRLLKKYGLKWPSSRKRKQPQDARSKKQKTKSPRVGKISSMLNLVDPANLAGHNLSVEQFINIQDQLALTDPVCDVPCDVNAALRRITQALSMSTVGGRQSVKERSNGAEGGTSLDSIQQPKSSSTFIVKADYNGDIVKFDFSLSFSIEQLKEEVGSRLELDIVKIKMKYLDEENDWILIKFISDLEHALRFANSSGSSVVKLSITTSES